MKTNKTLIDDLRAGKIALLYDGSSYDKLCAILKDAFPNDLMLPWSDYFYVYKHPVLQDKWYMSNVLSATEFTVNQRIPIKDFIDEEEDFVLPEKWCVLRTSENYEVINQWLNKNTKGDYDSTSAYIHFPNYADYKGFKRHNHSDVSRRYEYTQITFEQFKKYVLTEKEKETMEKYKFTLDYITNNNIIIECTNSAEAREINYIINAFDVKNCSFNNYNHTVYICKLYNGGWHWQDEGKDGYHKDYFQKEYPNIKFEVVNALDFIKNYIKMGELKIIGYKAPLDMYKGEVKKGDLYIQYTSNENLFVPEKSDNAIQSVPKEIAETWEPVYGPSYNEGDWCIFNLNSSLFIGQYAGINTDKKPTSNNWKLLNKNVTKFGIVRTPFDRVIRKATPEEIEEAQKQVFDMGNFKIIVKNGKAYHNNEDITVFVKDMVSFYSQGRAFGGFGAETDEITFKRTGCERNQTKLSDWKKVYDKMNE